VRSISSRYSVAAAPAAAGRLAAIVPSTITSAWSHSASSVPTTTVVAEAPEAIASASGRRTRRRFTMGVGQA
jgi:hypothetical protein